MRFKDLGVGDTFTFDGEGKYLGMARGPWTKYSARKYRHTDEDDTVIYKVGSINVLVNRLKRDTTHEEYCQAMRDNDPFRKIW